VDLALANDNRTLARKIASPELPGVNTLLTLTVCVVVVAALYCAREVLIPVTLAGLLSFLLAPIVSLLRRARVPRIGAVLLSILTAMALILALGVVIEQQIADLAPDLPYYQYEIETKIETLRKTTLGRAEPLLSQLGGHFGAAPAPPAPPPGPHEKHAAPVGSTQNPMTVLVQSPPPSAASIAQDILSTVLSPLGTLLLVVIVAVFVLMQKEDLRDRLIRLFGSTDLHRTTLAMNDAGRRLSTYFLTQLGINAAFGVIIGAGLFMIGIPGSVLWGLVAMLARFVPYAGVFIAGAVPVLLAAGTDPTWHDTLVTVALYLVVEPIIGQVIEPLAYGHSTGLSPVSIVIAAIFWTWIWGPIGLLLSTPLTLCLVVLGRHVKRLEFLDVLLGDRPALTPVESFYQRILAGDPDEAVGQAEFLLRDRPLSAYYDEVALPSLQLAAVDAARGVLTEDRQLRMREAVQGLLDDLDVHDDTLPAAHSGDDGPAATPRLEGDAAPPPMSVPPSLDSLPPDMTSRAPVLCIGGRNPLDDAAAAMLAQILTKHGLPAQPLTFDRVTRAALPDQDLHGAALLVVSYMEATGTVTHLRALIRRLRQKAPAATVILGLWPAELPETDDDTQTLAASLREIPGIGDFASTLRDTATLCIEHVGRMTPVRSTALATTAE
jgi:predicted PurR-regulated permease PerM